MIDFVIRAVKFVLRVIEALWFYARTLTVRLIEADILFLASGLAFNGILTMVPLLLLGASALGIFLNSSELGVQQVNQILDALFPPQPFAMSIKESIRAVVSDIVVYRTSLGVFGALILIWTATSLFDAIRSVLHRIYGIPRSRGLLASLLHEIGFVFLCFVLFLATSVAHWVISVLEGIAANVPALKWVNVPSLPVPTIVVILLTTFMFYIIYRYLPDEKPPRAAGVISTITTTVLWVVSGKLFSIYLLSFSAIGKIYGAYAFILVLLIWVYYSSIVFIVGGLLGQVYWERLRLKQEGKLERWFFERPLY